MKKGRTRSRGGEAQTVGVEALASYRGILSFLTGAGQTKRRRSSAPELPLLESVQGIEGLFRTLSSVAPATPGASDEEWNPLSQRPHAPLPPVVTDELGAEITALKEAVDAFTTLAHEAMHVALWEPFFTGLWQPRSRRAFREFSLMAEGFCFFFSDIVVSGAVRVRLPDGEFALDRQTPSNARFPPARAFEALGIRDPAAILAIYLEGFSGGRTALWQPRGTNNFVAALASRAYDFYAGSQRLLDGLYEGIRAFGGLTEFQARFCAIPGLPTFLGENAARTLGKTGAKAYLAEFHRSGLKSLGGLSPAEAASVRWRRMLQVRAYYALQVRWLLREGLVVAHGLSASARQKLDVPVETYLDGLAALLAELARQPEVSPVTSLKALDAAYDAQVRARLQAHDAWVGHRWLIAPSRAGGLVSLFTPAPKRDATLATAAFLVDELAQRIPEGGTVKARAALLAGIQRIAAAGAVTDGGVAARKLRTELARPEVLAIWSVPLAAFDPVGNRYRELVFSYQ